jgi:TfoX/Sxy family transcriptional regulator of competence genes
VREAMRKTRGMAYDDALAARVRDLLAAEPGLTEKRMFGALAFFVGGNLAVSASSNGGLLVRVDPAKADELLAEPDAEPFEMHGRSRKGWLHVDATAVDSDAALARWVDRGVGYARSLPVKA